MADSLVPVKEIEEKMDTDKMWIIMGPQHPFSHGLWTLKIQVDGEIVTDATERSSRTQSPSSDTSTAAGRKRPRTGSTPRSSPWPTVSATPRR